MMPSDQQQACMMRLPNELLVSVLGHLDHLDPRDLGRAMRVNHLWRECIDSTARLRRLKFMEHSNGDRTIPRVNPLLPVKLTPYDIIFIGADDVPAHTYENVDPESPRYLTHDEIPVAVLFESLGGENWNASTMWRDPDAPWRKMLVASSAAIDKLVIQESRSGRNLTASTKLAGYRWALCSIISGSGSSAVLSIHMNHGKMERMLRSMLSIRERLRMFSRSFSTSTRLRGQS